MRFKRMLIEYKIVKRGGKDKQKTDQNEKRNESKHTWIIWCRSWLMTIRVW
jgi:hypothetical protein